MAEIIIRIDSNNETTATFYLRVVKWAVLFINATAFTVMVVEAIYFVKALDNTYSCYVLLKQTSCIEYFYNFMTRLGKFSGSYYGILSLALIFTYAKLNCSLRRRFSNDVSNVVMRSLNTLFGVLVVSYVLRTVYLFMQGSYHTFIQS